MSLIAGIKKLLSERPGCHLVGDVTGASRLTREAADEFLAQLPPAGAPPDVVALVCGTPLVVRSHVPVGTVYVVQPAAIPSPTLRDRDLAAQVARFVNLALGSKP